MVPVTRRALLTIGTTAVTAWFAGCSGTGNPQNTIDGETYPNVHDWLTTHEWGAPPTNYYGQLADRRGADTVTVQVGSRGNNGYLAFDPPGVVVSPGTTVQWSWTGKGGPHNVDADPDEQLGQSTYAFDSGDPVETTGVAFTHVMDRPGIALYHCDVHWQFRMKGAVAVD